MSHSLMVFCVLATLLLALPTATSATKECSTDCSVDVPAVDLDLVLPPELYEPTRLGRPMQRPSAQFKMKRDYDFVRFGRSAPSKKATYDYIRFGRK